MTQEQYIYTVCSTDKDHYNRIFANLEVPNTEYCQVQVSELTTKCSILVLTKQDYFTINGKKYNFLMDYSDLNNEVFVELVDDLVANDGYFVELDTTYRIHIFAVNEFELGDMSYNCKLLFGLHDIDVPIISKYNPNLEPVKQTHVEEVVDEEGETQIKETTIVTEIKHELFIESVGFTLSTPVLYLLSNIGCNTYHNKIEGASQNYMSTLRTAMRINNSFSANFNIVSGNTDFEAIIKSNNMSNVQFILVDANLKEITLLSPMYITIHVLPIPDLIRTTNEIETFVNIQQAQQQQ